MERHSKTAKALDIQCQGSTAVTGGDVSYHLHNSGFCNTLGDFTTNHGILWFHHARFFEIRKKPGGWQEAYRNPVVDVMEDVLKLCHKITQKKGVSYVLKSKDIESDKVFAASGLLPSIIKRADQLSLLLFGHKTESVFKDNEKSMLGVEVSVKECKKLTSLLCISDVLCELIKRSRNNKVDVDELLYD